MCSIVKGLGPLIIVLLLGACGGQDSATETAPQPASDNVEPAPRSTPAEAPPDPAGPVRRTADSDLAPDALQYARAERERLRERFAPTRTGWDDEQLAELLDLNAEQLRQLQQARETLLAERVSGRNLLRAQRDLQVQAETAGDSIRLEEAQAQTRQVRARLERAEQAWLEALRSILDADQLQRLSEQRPELVQPANDR